MVEWYLVLYSLSIAKSLKGTNFACVHAIYHTKVWECIQRESTFHQNFIHATIHLSKIHTTYVQKLHHFMTNFDFVGCHSTFYNQLSPKCLTNQF